LTGAGLIGESLPLMLENVLGYQAC
jgi:hypothetical protein